MDIPLGGGKAALSATRRECRSASRKACRGFEQVHKIIGPLNDVPAPVLASLAYSDDGRVRWAYHGDNRKATGMGGCWAVHRGGLGVVFAEEALARRTKTTASIQGFNVAEYTARKYSELGGAVAVSWGQEDNCLTPSGKGSTAAKLIQ